MKAEFQVTYFLWKDRKDKDGLAPVYIRSKQNSDKQYSYNTGVKIHPQAWNKKKNAPTSKPVRLLELEGKLQATYKDLVAQGNEPTLMDLLAHQNDLKRPTDNNIAAWCDDYLKSPSYSDGQKKAVKTLKFNLVGDDETPGFNKGLTFDKLTKPRLKAFFEFLTARGVANNSQYKRLRALINVANHANIDAPHLNSYEMPYTTVNALKVRLTWSEVKQVMETDPETKIEQTAKDAFLLACFSGLRIGDILTLNEGELNAYHYEKEQHKTKLPVLVTVHKYNQDLFKRYSKEGFGYVRQRLSDALKPLLKRSGLTKNTSRVQAVGNSTKRTTRPKYQEISFHSGRRFYARLLNDLGLGGEIARDELGHSFKSVTELYAGSPEHSFRVNRVRKAMEQLEQKMEELALMMVA